MQDPSAFGALQRTTDSAVELTSPPMQRPSIRFSDQPAVLTSDADPGDSTEAGQAEHHGPRPSFSAFDRPSTPAALTSAEVDALAKNLGKTSSKNLTSSGVDMYSTDSEVPSSPLGSRKKSVTEAYEHLWS